MRRAAALAVSLTLSACAGSPPPLLVLPYLSPAELAARPATPAPAFDPPTPMSDDRRWLATAHAELRPSLAAGLFDCALGARLSGTRTPALTRIFARIQRDLDAAGRGQTSAGAKAPLCTRPNWTPAQAWPGRLPALGVAYADVMAHLAPDRATALIATGRAVAESAVLCGLSTPEDAAAASALAHSVVAAVARSPAFAGDMAAARAEIDAVRASGLTSPACAAERLALAQ